MKSRLLVPVVVIATALSSSATVVLTPVSLAGAVASESSDPFGFPASRAIDGVTTGANPDFSHTNNGPNEYWRLITAANVTADRIRVYNRTDCCADRLNGAVLNAYSDAGLTNNIFTSAPVAGSPRFIDYLLPSGSSLRGIQVNHQNQYLSLSEVQLFNSNNVTLPLGTDLTRAGISAFAVSQSSEYLGGQFPAGNAVDGSASNFSHTDGGAAGNAWWKADLGETMRLESVNIHNRGDGCCQERLRDLRVDVLDGSGTSIWNSVILNPLNALGSPSDIFIDLTALNGGVPLLGNQVMVTRIRDATGGVGPDDANVLSMGELTLRGGSVPEPGVLTMWVLSAACLVGRRRRA